MPITSRPPDNWSMVAAALAVSIGWRNEKMALPVASAIERVRAARNDR